VIEAHPQPTILNRDPPDSAQLDGLAAIPMGKLLRRDPVHPRAARPASIPEATAPLKRHRERLGQQIRRDLRVQHATVEVGEQVVRKPVTQLPELRRIAERGQDQLSVGHHPNYAASRAERYVTILIE
jgi:hypothetical protein